ncbi:MAG: nucleotidyltransferase domain-containing protein [Nitrospirae bacterium]|nr:MAG: nucleotidyltransferase domain-containing protein [Nitrospirota bacterium]
MIEDLLKEILSEKPEVVFGILFGSLVTGGSHNLSDLDIGVYFAKEVELIELGGLVSSIEMATNMEVDLVVLNELYKSSPHLAYEIVSKGKVIFCRDQETLWDFKTRTFLYYLDQRHLIEDNQKRLLQRIKEGTFAEGPRDVKKAPVT